MKALKRIGVISMTILLVTGGAGCGRFGKGNTDDPNTLYVGNYQGGLGKAWLEEIANKFEAENPGINVEIDEEKDRFGDSMLLQNIKHFRQDVYFLNQITYSNYVNAGVLADITDVVTEKRAEPRLIDGVETVQSVSIEEKWMIILPIIINGTKMKDIMRFRFIIRRSARYTMSICSIK